MPKVLGIDHVYVPVRDFVRSQAFYDRVMGLLDFRKGTMAIGGDPHAHYFNEHLALSIRPARSGERAEAYRVGSLHHLCFRVADNAAVDATALALNEAGIAATPPRLYPEYDADYYATFFEDPDGLRLEVVADRRMRKLIRERWNELTEFENPISKAGLT